jgi:hypothetical protein
VRINGDVGADFNWSGAGKTGTPHRLARRLARLVQESKLCLSSVYERGLASFFPTMDSTECKSKDLSVRESGGRDSALKGVGCAESCDVSDGVDDGKIGNNEGDDDGEIGGTGNGRPLQWFVLPWLVLPWFVLPRFVLPRFVLPWFVLPAKGT